MKRSIGILCGLVLSALAAPVQAQDYYDTDGGLYISGRGGLSLVRDNTWFLWGTAPDNPFTPGVDPVPPQSEYRKLELDPGFVAGGAIGYTFAYPQHVADIRVEAEGSFRYNAEGEINSDWDAFGHQIADIDGNVQLISVMGNVLVDFHTGSRFVPFIGAGAGVTRMHVDVSVYDFARTAFNWPFPTVIDEIDYSLSWQLIGGLGYRLSPGTVIATEYRYFRLASDRFSTLFQHEELSKIQFEDWSVSLRFTF